MTGGGMGLKTNDRSTMSLCITCHSDFHRLSGRFKGWTKEQVRTWQQIKVVETIERLCP